MVDIFLLHNMWTGPCTQSKRQRKSCAQSQRRRN